MGIYREVYEFRICHDWRGARHPMDPIVKIWSLVTDHRDEQGHWMRVHRHLVVFANRPRKGKVSKGIAPE